jgi:hypothetical protein
VCIQTFSLFIPMSYIVSQCVYKHVFSDETEKVLIT